MNVMSEFKIVYVHRYRNSGPTVFSLYRVDLSRNNWWVGILAFGEGWHDNHHAFMMMYSISASVSVSDTSTRSNVGLTNVYFIGLACVCITAYHSALCAVLR